MVEHERLSATLAEQVAYYRRAAADFDKYAYDEFLDVVASRLQGQVDLAGDVLEIACGAGQWTAWLAESAHFLTAIDSAPEMLEFARRRLKGHPTAQVELLCADVFEWRPQRRYQTVFFAFWLSHVPPSRFAAFWELMAACLAPRGSVAFVDDGAGAAAYEDDLVADPELPTARRRLHGAGWRRGGNAFWQQNHELAMRISSPNQTPRAGWSKCCTTPRN